jgi:hypothetical protein
MLSVAMVIAAPGGILALAWRVLFTGKPLLPRFDSRVKLILFANEFTEEWCIVKALFFRFANLFLGLLLFAVGIVFTMKANIGFAPWDVLHSGLSDKTGISFGMISILIGLLICVAIVLLGEKIGLGTVLNMVLIGTFIDILLKLNLIPTSTGIAQGTITVVLGLLIIAFGSYFYIKPGFGAGPRDYLMIVIRRRTKLSVGVSRGLVEGSAVLLGWILGGPVGGGTVLAAFGISVCIQLVFSLLKFEPAAIQHETLGMTLRHIRHLLVAKPSNGAI